MIDLRLGFAVDHLRYNQHLTFFTGIAVMISVVGFTLLGDGIREALNPWIAKR